MNSSEPLIVQAEWDGLVFFFFYGGPQEEFIVMHF